MNEIIINGIIERSQEVSGEMRYAVGAPGADGVGISDIFKTSTVGNVDTYTIFLTDGTTKTFTVTNGIENIDQTYSPTSENAQSGIAVAQAVDPRTVYQKFIDDNNLKQRNWVDLSFVGGEYYYTDFLQAVVDVNADTTENSVTDSTSAVCQIFKNKDITVLRLLSDLSVTTAVIFEKSVIFDINGYEVSLTNNAVFGEQKTGSASCPTIIRDCTIIFYGAKIGSIITAIDSENMINCSHKYTYVCGGKYELICGEDNTLKSSIIKNASNNSNDTILEVINTDMSINASSTSSKQAARCILIYTEDENNHILNIYNSKMYQYSENRAVYSVYILPKSTISNPNIIVTFKQSKFISKSPANLGDASSSSLILGKSNVKIEDCYIEGMSCGIQNSATVFLNNCICKSVSHGGIYNQGKAILYAQNSEFHKSLIPEGYTPSGSSAAYFGYGSVAYIDGCSFILDTDGDTSDGIAIKQGSGTIPTNVFISNSEIPKLRCDSGQYVYLGEGISDTIRNTTVNGTKVLTDENYSTYINKEMSQPVVDIEYEPTSRSPQSGIAVAEAVVEAKDYTNTKIGDIDTALDNIVSLQNSYIGGNS